MKLYSLHTKQKIPLSKKEAWKFLADPKNLKTITPDYMGFDIVSGGDSKMYAGQIIHYIVTPVAGIKTNWITEITHVKEGKYFVDEQRFGPYSMWHHKHFIHEIEGGVEMEDLLHYKLPLGFIGRIVHRLVIEAKLQEIFKYRQQKLNSLFGRYD